MPDFVAKLITANDEIARLEQITRIQQKQLERLMAARDAEKTLRKKAEAQARKLSRIRDKADNWQFNQFVELNSRGADRNENPDYRELKKLQRILNKPL
jgi:hypothetical protein